MDKQSNFLKAAYKNYNEEMYRETCLNTDSVYIPRRKIIEITGNVKIEKNINFLYFFNSENYNIEHFYYEKYKNKENKKNITRPLHEILMEKADKIKNEKRKKKILKKIKNRHFEEGKEPLFCI